MTHAPALFVSHGAPTFALEPGVLGPNLTQLGARLSNLAAVAVVSAHWQTRTVQVMRTPEPETVHDFGGFPPALYQLRYPAPGAPAIAAETAALLKSAGIETTFDDARGIDHGVWVPLLYLLPKAQVPVFQISLPLNCSAEYALRLGRALKPLRRRGVLVMGSGSLTHNQRDIGQFDASLSKYVAEFTAWVRTHVQRRDMEALVDYRRRAPHAERAHPSEEHFLPLLVALGASEDGDAVNAIEGGVTYGVLSMESYVFEIGQSEPRLGSGAAV
jgi:4,5-DOPA dioxygenase extradiol